MHPSSLLDIFLRQTRPETPAAYTYLRDGELPERTLGHYALLQRAKGLAGWLLSQGLAGERAMMVFPTGLEFVEAFLACMIAGVTAVPVAPAPLRGDSSKVRRMHAIMQDCAPAIVLGVGQTIGEAPAFVQANPAWQGVRWLDLDAFEGWDAHPDLNIGLPAPDDIALLQYTSGSTGLPKGVMLSHRNILYNLVQWDEGLGHDDHSKMVCWVPHYHDLGLLYGVLFPMYRSISAYLLPGISVAQKPLRWLKALSDYKGTHSMGPNFIYEHCSQRIAEADLAGLDLSAWRMGLNAAEPIRAETVALFNRRFGPCGVHPHTITAAYGLAEATCIVTGQNWDTPLRTLKLSTQALQHNRVRLAQGDEAASEVAACGHPLLATTLKIVDPVSLAPCEPDQVGEIWIHSDNVSSGYWRRPEESAKAFGATIAGDESGQRYLRTGDLGFMHEGDVFTTGRMKDVIIVRGENFYPQDAEWEVERAHPAFKASGCAVFAVPRDGEERVVVVQELMRGEEAGPHEERFAAIRRAVSTAYDLPVEAMVLIKPGTTAKTSSGKIQRQQSRQAFLDGGLQVIAKWDRVEAGGVPIEPPAHQPADAGAPAVDAALATEIERFLVQRIAEIARMPAGQVRANRPFSEYGMGSLESTTLADELASRFGLAVPPTVFYDHPDVRRLSAHLGMQQRAASRPATGGGVQAVQPEDDAIVVVGMACRFPGAASPQAYWDLLSQGRSGIGTRQHGDGTPRHGGFVDDVASFDNGFFAINKREAACMDPQQRMALEVSWQALEDAGIQAADIAGSDTGVFFGASAFDYGSLQLAQSELDAYSSQGSVLAVIANRIAYQLDLRGPSFVVDTACSSALTTVHLACRSLRDAECKTAIVGAVNVLLASDWDRALTKAGMLAPDGQCKTFDASADGYVRSEGCGVLVLKRHKDALADGDRIYGAILGSAINQDGRSNGLTAPNGQAQEALVLKALANAKVDPGSLQYIEAHGTGTPLGDPIECKALQRVLSSPGADRRDAPCHLGSAKANVGHLEAAAGMAGLIKTLLALHHQTVPMQRNLSLRNPLIDLDDKLLRIPLANLPWPREAGQPPRRASVSAFGFSGTNACVVVGDVGNVAGVHGDSVAPPDASSARQATAALPFVLSARDKPALRRLALAYAAHLPTLPEQDWPRFLYSSTCRRAVQPARFAVAASNAAVLTAQLQALAHGADAHVADHTEHAGQAAPRIAFVYSGQGIPLKNAGRELFDHLPVFREALSRCNEVLQPLVGHRLETLLYGSNPDIDLARPSLAQPVHFAIQYALSETLAHFGIHADVTLGHSLGEYAALVTAGAMPLATALQLVAARGSLAEHEAQPGAMAAVFADEDTVRSAILLSGIKVDLAAINGLHHCVVAGTGEAVTAFCAHLVGEHAIEHRKLHVERAYHAALIEPIVPTFMRQASGFAFEAPRIDFISNVTGRRWPSGKKLSAPYFARHLREPVRFTDSLDALAQDDRLTLAIEIGTKPVLCGIAEAYLDNRGPRWQPLLRHNGQDQASLLDCLLQLALAGRDVNWLDLFATEQRKVVSLPGYAFDRSTHWFRPRDGSTQAMQAEQAPQPATPSAVPPPLARSLVAQAQASQDAWNAVLERGTKALDYFKAVRAADLTQFEVIWKGLESACPLVMAASFAELGLFQSKGEQASAQGIAQRFGFKDSHLPLLGQWLAALCQVGLLREAAGAGIERGYANVVPFNHKALKQQVAELFAGIQTREDYEPFVDYVKKSAANQVRLLKGEANPLELLFPDGESRVADALYQLNPVSRMHNEIAVAVLRELVDRYLKGPHAALRPMRILELGAGTGGTSASMLGVLPRAGVVYHFTDVSHFFTDRAKARFADLPFIEYGLFDINKGPLEQGYELASFDLILSANAVHATQYIDQTLRHLCQMLVPGGSLMLIEGTVNTPIQMLTLAHIESFGHYQDHRKESNLPFMSVDEWRRCTAQAGFARFASVPGEGIASTAWPQHVLLARTAEAVDAVEPADAMVSPPSPQAAPAAPPAQASPTDQVKLGASDNIPAQDTPQDTQQALRQVLARLIHVAAHDVDPEATFMELGVDSIVLMEFARVVGKRHGIKLTVRQIFEQHPSVAVLSRFIDAQAANDTAARTSHQHKTASAAQEA